MTHKLIFSNDFDGRVHVDFNKVPAVGVKFVGPLGLLGELELRAGLTCFEHREYDRFACFKEVLTKYMSKKADSIFNASFVLDSDSVARQILRWRDALVMAGWNDSTDVESPLLNELKDIEKAYKEVNGKIGYQSVSDRWERVLDYYRGNKVANLCVEVVCKREHINPTILAVLDNINGHDVEVSFKELPETNTEIKAYSFDDVYDAYAVAALTLDPKKDVIINQDTKAFNNFLDLFGMGNTTSSLKECNAPILQLFKLQLLLLAEPKNIYNIVSYLKTRPCPVKGGALLGDYLMEHCGWGKESDWNEFLEKSYNEDGEKVTSLKDKQKESVKAFKAKMTATDNEINFSQAKEGIEFLKHWAENQTRSAENKDIEYNLTATEKAELNTLKGFCNQFLSIGRDGDDIVLASELVRYAETIYENGEYENTEAVVGSFDSYASLGCIYSPIENGKVVWVDCYGEPFVEYDYDFLSDKEKMALNNVGVRIWSAANQVAGKVAGLKAAANRCGSNLYLFVPAKVAGETTPTNPVLASLGLKPEKSALSLQTVKEDLVTLAAKKNYYKLDAGINERRKGKDGAKTIESYSSLSTLINSPLDYVMQYLAGISAPNIRNLDGISRIEGLIAHRTLENLADKYSKDAKEMLSQVETSLDKWIDEAANQVGLVMLLKENAVEYNRMKNILKSSFTNLLNIIINNNLSIDGMEMLFTDKDSDVTEGNADIEAKIDLVLKDGSENRYIFDLKYSKPKKYIETLQTNSGKALQLDIYQHCMQKDAGYNVVFTGYFILTDGTLYTTSSLLEDENIEVITKADNALTNPIGALKNGYIYRYSELAEGKIEEGEGEKCQRATSRSAAQENLDYYREEDTMCLYPIELYEKKKGENKYSNFKIFKGGLK